MFENINPMDRPTAFLEIAILLLITFIIGFISARIPIGEERNSSFKNPLRFKNKKKIIEEEEIVDPRDIITEPTTIEAILTRDRKGNAMTSPIDNKSSV